MLGIVRFLVYGPLLGALVGVVIAMAEVEHWKAAGKPDTYIRDAGGTELAAWLWSVGGAIVGIPFGLVVATFEYAAGRRVRIGLSVSLVVLIAFAACWIFYTDTLVGRRLNDVGIGPPTFTVLAALVVLFATSAPTAKVRGPKR
jgi:hypothetical protein